MFQYKLCTTISSFKSVTLTKYVFRKHLKPKDIQSIQKNLVVLLVLNTDLGNIKDSEEDNIMKEYLQIC